MTSFFQRFGPVFAVLVLASCASDTTEVVEDITEGATLPSGAQAADGAEIDSESSSTGPELCEAATYRPLIGTNIADATVPQATNLRVFGINDIVPRDFIPQRTNVVYETTGEIAQVFCG